VPFTAVRRANGVAVGCGGRLWWSAVVVGGGGFIRGWSGLGMWRFYDQAASYGRFALGAYETGPGVAAYMTSTAVREKPSDV
jgi:hypothetical protein